MQVDIKKAKDLVAELKKMAEAKPEDKAKLEEMVTKALEMTKLRKGEFDTNPEGNAFAQDVLQKSLSENEKGTQEGERILKVQTLNDDMYLVSKLLRTSPDSLKMFKRFQ
jgi:K+-sensing histidine kinase KdpD